MRHFFLIILFSLNYGQFSMESDPKSFTSELDQKIAVFQTPHINLNQILSEDQIDKNNGLPYSKTFVPKILAHAKKIINQCKMTIYLKDLLGTSSRNVLFFLQITSRAVERT